MINEDQARALSALLNIIRPRWSIPAMMKLLANNSNHPAPFADIAAAAVTAANDSTVTTPGLIFIDQRHWPEPLKPRLPPPTPCGDHPEEPAHICRCCWADVRAGDRRLDQIGKAATSGRRTEPPAGWRNHTEAAPDVAASSVERADE